MATGHSVEVIGVNGPMAGYPPRFLLGCNLCALDRNSKITHSPRDHKNTQIKNQSRY